MPNKKGKPREERYRSTMKRPALRDEQEAGPSKRRWGEEEAPPPSALAGSSDAYYDFYADDEPLLSPEDLQIDRERFSRATEEEREIVVYIVREITRICHRNPQVEPARMVHQILCKLGPVIPGMVKDPRSVLGEPEQWNIRTRNICQAGQVVGTFWNRGLEAGGGSQLLPGMKFNLWVDKQPLMMIGHPYFQAWVVFAELLDADEEPGEPFVVSAFCGSVKPSAPILLGPVCEEAARLRQHKTVSTRNVLCDAEARALVKETVAQNTHYGCHKCTIKGVRVGGKKISFHDNRAAQPRTHALFVQHGYDDEHRKQTPTRRANPLEQLGIDVVNDVSIADDRHLLHWGAAKTFFNTFTNGLNNATEMNEESLELLHLALCNIRFPAEREHNKFSRHISMWPPSMWAYFLDVVGCVVLEPVLQHEDYTLWMFLHLAVAICNHNRYTHLLDYANNLFESFVDRYAEVVKFVPNSIHLLLHVVEEIRRQKVKALRILSTNRCEALLTVVPPSVNTHDGSRVMGQLATAVMLAECSRIPGSFNPTPTHNGRRAPIRPKFLLRSEEISLTDADSWFLTATGRVVKFESASVDNLGLVVLGRPLNEQRTMITHTEPNVPVELNIFQTKSKGEISENLVEYRTEHMIAKLGVVDMENYTSFVPLYESLPK